MRLKLAEITPRRVCEAAHRRIIGIAETVAWRRTSFAATNKGRLNSYRDRHRGARCFIIANGPSLAAMDLSILRDEFTISMNRAYLLYPQWGFVPSYYVCINELVIEQFAEDIARLESPRFVNFNRRRCFPNLDHDASLMYLHVGLGLEDRFQENVENPIASGGTVTFASLQLAFFMGFSEVILLGLDHSFAEKGTPNKTEIRQSGRDESHCHPNYFPKGTKWQLPDLYRSELAYAKARSSFEAAGRRIVDATNGGACRVFPKVSIQDLF